MCIQKITHTLKCDIRPLATFADPNRPIINPWATPEPCNCKHQTTQFSQCKFGHKCCIMTATNLPCTSSQTCSSLSQYHVYLRSKSDPEPIPWESFDGFIASRRICPVDRQVAPPDEGWAPLPVIDEQFKAWEGEMVPYMSVGFVAARKMYLDQAVTSYRLLLALKKARSQREEMRDHLFGAEHYNMCQRKIELSKIYRGWTDHPYRCVTMVEEAQLYDRICHLEDEHAKLVVEAMPCLEWLFELSVNEEGWIENLDPW